MNEHLFKLKRKGTITGYKKTVNGLIFIKSTTTNTWGCLTKQTNFNDFVEYRFAIDEDVIDELYVDSLHPFVTKDKNGKDIFEGDCCHSGIVDGYICWSDMELVWKFEWFVIHGCMHSVFVAGLSDIELIEEKKMREHDITLVRGDLAFCKVCKAGEGELTTECCGRRMSEEERNRVYKIGDLDFINDKWTKKRK